MPDFPRSDGEVPNTKDRSPITVAMSEIVDAESDDIKAVLPKAIAFGVLDGITLPHTRILEEECNRKDTRIAVQSKGRILLFDASDLVAVEAQGNYVLLQRQACSHLVRISISSMAVKLRPYGFVRVHRSVLINSAHVDEVRASVMGEYRLSVRSGKVYTVSRRYIHNLRLLAGAWITAHRLEDRS